MIDKIFLILLCVLPFSNFLFRSLDIWHGQGMFFQLGILALFCWSLIARGKNKLISNIPLASITLWFGLLTSYVWVNTIVATKQYPVMIFFPFFNFLCFLLFYKTSAEYLNEKNIIRILKFLSYSVFVVIVYSYLQKLNLDQFYKGLGGVKYDELVGTIGNTSHLAGYLAMCQPLFFKKSKFNILALVMLWGVLIMCKSASGLLTGLAIVLFYLLLKKRYKETMLIFIVSLIPVVLFRDRLNDFFTFSGRLEIWKLLFERFKEKPITGWGLGIINAFKIKPEGSLWRHAHQEYYQYAIETGLIGLSLIVWAIIDYFRNFRTLKTDLAIKLASIFFGFCFLGLFTFCSHLWLLASMGIISYSFLYALKGEIQNG